MYWKSVWIKRSIHSKKADMIFFEVPPKHQFAAISRRTSFLCFTCPVVASANYYSHWINFNLYIFIAAKVSFVPEPDQLKSYSSQKWLVRTRKYNGMESRGKRGEMYCRFYSTWTSAGEVKRRPVIIPQMIPLVKLSGRGTCDPGIVGLKPIQDFCTLFWLCRRTCSTMCDEDMLVGERGVGGGVAADVPVTKRLIDFVPWPHGQRKHPFGQLVWKRSLQPRTLGSKARLSPLRLGTELISAGLFQPMEGFPRLLD